MFTIKSSTNKIHIVSILFFGLIAIQCQSPNRTSSEPASGNTYSAAFSIKPDSNGFILNLYSPWMNEQSAQFIYHLSRNLSQSEIQSFDNQYIPIPVKKVVVLSTTHLAFIEALNEIESIVGISDSKYVNSPPFIDRNEHYPIANIGDENTIDYEVLMHLNPDVCFFYGISSAASQTAERIASLGIPVVFISEFNENNPLGRLEWIRYVSCFYDKLPLADSIFRFRVASYKQAQQLIRPDLERPTVLTGFPWKDVWNIPGANSFTATLIKDAGGDYIFSHLNQKINYQLSFEEVYFQAVNASFWINTGYASSLSDIWQTDKRMTEFKAFRTVNIFNNNRRQNPYGGNDYMESGILYPDSVLLDLISIFHPTLLPNHQPRYYQRLK